MRKLKHYLKIYFITVSRSYMVDMEYRINFLISILNSVFSFGATLIFFEIVYGHTKTLGGWSKYELLLLLGVYLFMKGVFEFGVRKGLDRLPRYVRKGTFDALLLRPINSLFSLSASRLDFDDLSQIVLSFVVMRFAYINLHREIVMVNYVAFGLLLLCAVVVLFSNYVMIMTTTFYLTQIHHEEIYKNLFQMARVPLDIYDRRLQYLFTYLIPLAFLVMIPAKAFLGSLHPIFIIAAPIFAVFNFYLAVCFWHYALKRYTSAGG